MSRISDSKAYDIAAAAPQHETQRDSEAPQNGRPAHVAALYRETSFTYGSAEQASSLRSQRARKMALQLARKKRSVANWLRRSLRRGRSEDPEGGEHRKRLRDARDGGNRGGDQPHNGQDDDGDAPLPLIRTRVNAKPVPPPNLQLVAGAARFPPGEESTRADFVLAKWENLMLCLWREIKANPEISIVERLLEISLDWVSVMQLFGPLPPRGGIAALRERTSQSGGSSAATPSGAQNTGGDIGSGLPPERVQRFNALFPLFWLHAELRTPPSHTARSIAVLYSQHAGVLTRRDVSSPQHSDDAVRPTPT